MTEETYFQEETYPWTPEYPFRHIKSSEFPGFIIDDYTRKRIYIKNTEAKIDKESKYWNLIKVLKSSTKVIHWLVKMHNEYFVVSQSHMHMIGDVISIYESDSRGRYDNLNPVIIYKSYLDIESAVDSFSQEYMAVLINERHPDINFLF